MDEGKLARAMNLSVAEGALATVMGTLAGGVFLTGFALEMGASRLQVGIFAALPVLANLAQLLGAFTIERTGDCKRMCMWTSILSRLLWLPILIVPLALPGSQGTAVWCMIAAFALLSALGSLGGVGWLTWIKGLIPAHRRVAFLGRRHVFNTGLSLTLGMAGALYLDWSRNAGQALSGFVVVFAVAMICGLIGLPLLGAIPAPPPTTRNTQSLRQLMFQPLRDANFRRLVGFYASWNLAVHMAQPFFAVYMLQKLNLSFAAVTGLATLSSVLGLITANFWTRLSARFGTKPVVLIATIADVLVPVSWLFVTPETGLLLVLLHGAGVLSAPLAMGPNNILLRLAPERNASPYLAIFNAIVGTTSAVAAILGGYVATALIDWTWSLGAIEVGGLKTVFLLSAVGRLVSIPLLLRLSEPSAHPVAHIYRVYHRHARIVRFQRREQAPAIRHAA